MAIKHSNGLIGYHGSRKLEFFSATDTKELFEHNLIIKPDDWIYRNKGITYARNNLGHRCMLNIKDLTEPYILFTGCSFTEGIGLSLEDTYPFILSKKIGIPYYNLAMAGSGWDLVIYNLNIWLELGIKQPKYLIIQWPSFYRYFTMHDQNVCITTINSKSFNELNISDEEFKYNNIYLFEQMMEKLRGQNIKFLNFTLDKFSKDLMNDLVQLDMFDVARDGHPGIKSNRIWAYQIGKLIK